jgi:hypothetical protein
LGGGGWGGGGGGGGGGESRLSQQQLTWAVLSHNAEAGALPLARFQDMPHGGSVTSSSAAVGWMATHLVKAGEGVRCTM